MSRTILLACLLLGTRCQALDEDRCLDAGGRWHQGSGACEGAAEHYKGKRLEKEDGGES